MLTPKKMFTAKNFRGIFQYCKATRPNIGGILTMLRSRIRLDSSKDLNLTSCPSCRHKQSITNLECEACGIIFSKYMSYSPIKTQLNKFISPSEVADIRNTQERFTRVKHDVESKVELIVHCHKEKLLDLAAHHLKQDSDKNGINIIKRLVSSSYNEFKQGSFLRLVNTISKPTIMIPSILLFLLVVLTILLRKSIS